MSPRYPTPAGLARSGLRNFSWVIPEALCGLALPGRLNPLDADVAALREHGVTLLVNATEEIVDPDVIRAGGIEPLHIPVRAFGPPTQDQLRHYVERARAEIDGGGAVAVHCFAGMGRTGTFLAAHLVALGRTGDAAIKEIRELRRGSIETHEQELAVLAFAGE